MSVICTLRKKVRLNLLKLIGQKFPVKMTLLLVNFTRKIVYLSWLKNSVYIYPDIIISVNITEKYIVKVVLSYTVGSVTVYTI